MVVEKTMTFLVNMRETRVESDGNSAIVREQFAVNPYTHKIHRHLVSHAVKPAGGWKLDFISWSFIPKNEDVEK